ncbi:hypothetical protein CLV46_3133 [Diaminobutyricimonas aerilata]|uniref:Uncharacterized protein n=1 Tax=Diaminobutyricimonas aerilata TaxID=1162967 RepID=A0A2M9CNQ5_9MICO|nr:hypothetical protein [Diaminobutyricimonas aerilata]PJJ73540.1 hypothetical protein CLV46_3133 [Diaminobutyricimonas aerilata]
MPRIRPLLLPAVAVLVIAPTLAACTAPAPDAAGPTIEWAASTLEEQTARLVDAERELDALLAAEAGMADALGVSGAEAAEALPRLGAPSAPLPAASGPVIATASLHTGGGVAPADYPVPRPDLETVGAAANSLSLLHDIVRDALGEASLNSTDHSAASTPAAGANPAIEWSVEKGSTNGVFTSSISDTDETGNSVTVALEGAFELSVCPDENGAAEGSFYATAAVTFTPAGGTPKRTAIDLDMDTIAHVNDEAYAYELWASVDSAVRTGAPAADSATRIPEPDSSRREQNAYAFEFGETGVADRGELTADQQLDGAFSVQVDDLAEQIALLLARAAEDYWRDGNCVDVVIEGEDVAPMPGDKQQLWVDAVSVVDGEKITRGTVELTGILGDSTVNPTGPQKIADADYQFIAGQEYGKADPDFEVVTRRGIGRGGTGITVVGDVWTFTESAYGADYWGLSCTGIRGPWEMTITVPMIAETWGTEVLFDENLRGRLTAPPTNGGEWVHPDTQFWLVAEGDGYVMHNDPEDVPMRVTRGDPSLCG